MLFNLLRYAKLEGKSLLSNSKKKSRREKLTSSDHPDRLERDHLVVRLPAAAEAEPGGLS